MRFNGQIKQSVSFSFWRTQAVCIGLLVFFLVSGCRKGEVNPGELPETKIFLDQIQLPDSLRLSTVVKLHWTGFVQKAYITGFEISLDGSNWAYTPRYDSTFVFTVPPGNQIADISFFVRALDNYGRKDPSPAFLKVPVQNTPPTITLQDTLADTVKTVFSLSWQMNDADGIETLDSVEIRINTGPWVSLPPATSLVTLIPNQPEATGSVLLNVLRGPNGLSWSQQVSGAQMEAVNQISIRGKDKSGAYSNEIQTASFFLQRKRGDLLVIDAFPSDLAARNLFQSSVSSVVNNYDFVSLLDNNRKYQPKYWNIAFKEWLSLYDKVFWYSNKNAYNSEGKPESGLLLETAAQAFQEYLNQGGKLLVVSSLPALDTNYNFISTSPVFTLLPIDTLSTSVGQARLSTDSLVLAASGSGYPNLTPSQFLTGISSFHPRTGSEVLYEAQLTPFQGWIGPKVTGARQRGNNGKVQLIYFSLDMHLLNKGNNLTQFFQQAFNSDFNW